MSQLSHEEAHNQARDTVNSWVARFVPLVMEAETLDLPATKEKLDLAEYLNLEAEQVTSCLAQLNALDDAELISTFRQARSQLPAIESDLRRRLGKLSPGHPESAADLTDLQSRLAETAAKIELGVDTTSQSISEFNEVTSPSNPAAAIGLFIFGLGWNAFTLFHATLMIGGMWMAFGPGALALLLFYAIFFFAGFAMWASAYVSAAEETVQLVGDQLTINRKLGPISTSKTLTVDPSSPATIGRANISSNKNSIPTQAVILTDKSGRPINIALQTTNARRQEICKKINNLFTSFRES